MKTYIKIFALLTCLITSLHSFAYDFEAVNSDGVTIYYNILSEEDKTCSVTYKDYTLYSGSVNIPSSVTYSGTTYSVTSIGSHAFSISSELTSVTIPHSVATISSYAFQDCTGLTSVTIPNSVNSIGAYAFSGCTRLQSITIPPSVTSVGFRAFSGCTGFPVIDNIRYAGTYLLEVVDKTLSTYTIQEGTQFIGDFSDCKNLTSLKIPDSVTKIGERAFSGCTALTSFYGKFASEDNRCLINNGSLVVFAPSGLTKYSIPNSATSIGNYAFCDCSGLTSVTIPNSVTYIGNRAFYGCSGITSVSIGNAVTHIGDYAFSHCTKLASVTIPNSVTSIGEAAFWYCTALTSVNISNYVTTIGEGAFYECTGLKTVNFNAINCTSVGEFKDGQWPTPIFGNCTNLTTVNIGENVRTLPALTFNSCTELTTVNFNAINCTVVGKTYYSVFNNCSKLSTVNIGENVHSIPTTSIFAECTGLSTVNFNATNCISIGGSFSKCPSLTTFNIGEKVQSLPTQAFYKCTGIKSITIPNSVDAIGGYAFEGCTGLTSFYGKFASNDNRCLIIDGEVVAFARGGVTDYVIPNAATSIGNYAFRDCTGLTSVIIPNSVTSIGEHAFKNCTGLTSVIIPESVTTIGDFAFSGCTGLTAITIPNSVTSIDSSAFDGCTSLKSFYGKFASEDNRCLIIDGSLMYFAPNGVTVYTIPSSVTSIGNYAFKNCTGLTSVNLPNSVTSIDYGAFENCTGLTSLIIPESVTTIGDFAFSGCTGLTAITIPNSVTSIGSSAFDGCTGFPIIDNIRYAGTYLIAAIDKSLSSYNIKEGTQFIGTRAFFGCSNLTSVTIPNSVTSIGNAAFYDCTGMASITIPNSVTSIGNTAFARCTGLSSIAIPNSVTSIGEQTFYECTGLTSVHIGNSVTSIGYQAFVGCTELTSVTLPNSLTTIGYGLFQRCNGLKSFYGKFASEDNRCLIANGVLNSFAPNGLTEYVIPNSVTSIGNFGFYNCSNLTSVNIPNSVTSIGDGIFSGCTRLKAFYGKFASEDNRCLIIDGSLNCFAPNGLIEYTIPNSVTSIGFAAFYGCEELKSVTISNSVKSIGIDAFWGCTGLKSVTIPNSVTHISYEAFRDCLGLTSMTIPNSVTSIGGYAFSGCKNLATIYCAPIIPPAQNTSLGFSSSVLSTCTLYVPKESIIDYKTTSTWSKFTNIVPLPDNYLNAKAVTTCKQKPLSIAVNLTNKDKISAFQCDIVLPSGFSIPMVEDEYDITLSSRATRSHTISSNKVGEQNTVRVLSYSSQSTAFTGNEGELFYIPINPVAEPGTYNVEIKNIIMADCNEMQYTCDDFSVLVEILPYLLGDANGDGTINVSDVVCTTNYILGKTPSSFIFEAADMNNDKDVNVTDVVLIVNKILEAANANTYTAERPALASVLNAESDASMYALDFSINSGETKEFEVMLDTPDFPVTAFQFNMTLPKGLSIVEEDGDFYIDQTSRATRSHTVSASLNKGVYTVLDYSSKNSNFTGNSGAVLKITVKADADFEGGELNIYNVVATESNGKEHKPAATKAKVTNPSGIDDVIAPDGEARYYNLQGIPVEGNITPGIYIEVRNGKARKVMVK